MKKTELNTKLNSHGLSRRDALNMKKTHPSDLLHITIVLLFGFLAIWAGRMMGYYMTPQGAIQTSSMLNQLQLPRLLPNQPVHDENGNQYLLWDLTPHKLTLLSVYAPWCGPCQKELPEIAEKLSEDRNFIVLISRDENVEEVREQLNNLGLNKIPFYQDVTGLILSQGKVTALPTTFLLKKNGRVQDRLVGYSLYGLYRLINQALEG